MSSQYLQDGKQAKSFASLLTRKRLFFYAVSIPAITASFMLFASSQTTLANSQINLTNSHMELLAAYRKQGMRHHLRKQHGC